MKTILIYFVFVFIFCLPAFGQTDDQLKNESLTEYMDREFKKYPAIDVDTKAKASLDFKSNPRARKFRTRLTEAWNSATEPNFAGHYFAVKDIGCGTGCLEIFVVDWNTGKISKSPVDDFFAVKRESRLLISKAYDTCTAYGGPEFFDFKNNKFRKIKNVSLCSSAGQT